jgi:hypothetical protein
MSMPPEMTAEDVLNYTLDRTGQGLDTNDFDLFATQFDFPHRISTFEGTTVLNTPEELETVFDGVIAHRKFIGATTVIRHVLSASYKTPTHVEGVHMSHVMAGELRIKEPYPSFSIIKWIDNSWKITASDYAIDPDDPQSGVLLDRPTFTQAATHVASRKNQ